MINSFLAKNLSTEICQPLFLNFFPLEMGKCESEPNLSEGSRSTHIIKKMEKFQ